MNAPAEVKKTIRKGRRVLRGLLRSERFYVLVACALIVPILGAAIMDLMKEEG